MEEKYFAQKIEDKWQRRWAESKDFESEIDSDGEKFYCLEMLPYPSGRLHMGHVRNYSIGDALSWYKRLQGFNVLHPIGWDSFGQPAEQAAIKKGVNPRDWTEDNINQMRAQLQKLGFSYDWRREFAAHRPEYYKFDQWFFLKMLERGLAYKKMTKVNWCPHDQTTLSNEQASGGVCWRCGNPVEKKDLAQWFLRITDYAEQLLQDMAELEGGWPDRVLTMQRNWIGRSEGAFVEFKIQNPKFKTGAGEGDSIRVFTTRIDTIYGANAIIVAAEHPILQSHASDISDDVRIKIEEIKTEVLRAKDYDEETEKDGVHTGLKVVNPFSGEELPVWVGNYVMMEYGTGAVMSVPAHDERDFEFAQKFNLPINVVINSDREHHGAGGAPTTAFLDYGYVINSGEWSGKTSDAAKSEMAEFAQKHNFGEAAVTYRLRDWGISRQRFWGSPIPIIYCEECGAVPEKYDNLPVRLPDSAPFTGSGESPLARVPEFVNTKCPKCGKPARRETDTMDTFVNSSWYYFRYTDPHNSELPFAPETAAAWTPVDQYIGGIDHAVMHLLYTRFWNKVMRDIGLVKIGEPVKKLLTQGMIVGEAFHSEERAAYLHPDEVEVTRDERGKVLSATVKSDGSPVRVAVEKMSKSKFNGIDPDDMVAAFGADASRLFTLFAAPVENELVWQETGIDGAVRFLQRVHRFVWRWKTVLANAPAEPPDSAETARSRKLRQKTHQTIRRVTDSFESLQLNTPVAALMELSNAMGDYKAEPENVDEWDQFAIREAVQSLVLMLAPYTPHFAEEIWEVVSGSPAGILSSKVRFPAADERYLKADQLEIPVQINGKLRSRVSAPPDSPREQLEALALADGKTIEYTTGKTIVKIVVVPNRLVNIVVK
jgi:leucyl-tRNA synthetase